MSRYIDAETLVNSINNLMTGYKDDIITLVKFIPTADVAEVKHGEWIHQCGCRFKCSECGREVISPRGTNSQSDAIEMLPYCHCGAKMGEGKTDE